MVISYSDDFIEELEAITDFIKLDNLNRANDFVKQLKIRIKKIPSMPFAYPQNQQANDENVRNLIYKGYTVVFRIAKEQIKILGIFKNNKHQYSNS